MVKDAPTIEQVLPDLFVFCGDARLPTMPPLTWAASGKAKPLGIALNQPDRYSGLSREMSLELKRC